MIDPVNTHPSAPSEPVPAPRRSAPQAQTPQVIVWVLDAEIQAAALAVEVTIRDLDRATTCFEKVLRARYRVDTITVFHHARSVTPPAISGGPQAERIASDLGEQFGRLLQKAILLAARQEESASG